MATPPSTDPERLPRLTKILCGAGDTGCGLTSKTIGAFLAIFLSDVVGLRHSLAALAIFVGRTWDYINDPLIGYTLAGLAGIGIGAAHAIPWAIIPDSVEWDEVATSQRYESMFYSLITLVHKVASSLAIHLALLVLDYTRYARRLRPRQLRPSRGSAF